MQPQYPAPAKKRVNPALVVGIAVVVVAALAWLAFGFFGIHTAFIDDEVAEGGPVFASGAEDDEFDAALDEAAENETEVSEEDPMPAEVLTLSSGSFSGDSGHSLVGNALVLNDGTEQRFLRFEEFESDNGPDLNVYLRNGSGDYVDLGDLKGNIGDQNYEIPTDVDIDDYNVVDIWCVRFGVSFGTAELAA